MKTIRHIFKACSLAALSTSGALAVAAPQPPSAPPQYWPGFHVTFPAKRTGFGGSSGGSPAHTQGSSGGSASHSRLPLWSYYRQNSRDPYSYPGFAVGADPFHEGGNSQIRTYIVPVVIKTHTVGTGFTRDTDGNIIGMTAAAGDTIFDPTQPDTNCLGSSNNVPITLVRQSPLFQEKRWKFGDTPVGNTQYIDAFQRASFWRALGDNRDNYHVRFSPIQVLAPVVLDVPPDLGTTFPQYSPSLTPCGPAALVDINYFDQWLDTVVIPALGSQGVDPNSLPIFVAGNVVWSNGGPPAFAPVAAGYHSFSSLSTIQTYAVAEFGTENFWTWPDTFTLSHELAEWVNDPYGNNPTPAWGESGQVAGCQDNFEVGDPLTGTFMPPAVGANGFPYSLQELAFFSWFFGGPSLGVNGWFSNNATFLTDAGPVCH